MAKDSIKLVSTLLSIDLFEGLEVEQAERIRDAGRKRTLTPGEVLTHPQVVDEALWVVLTGRLRIETADGVPLVDIDEPRVLGDMGVLLGLPRSTRVVAEDEAVLLEVSGTALEDLAAADPDIVQRLLGNLCRTLYNRLGDANDSLESLRRRHDGLRWRLAELAPDDPLLQE